MIEIKGLTYTYPDGSAALKDIDLTVLDGEFLLVCGPNGSGKTTLIRHMNGLLKPVSGSVSVNGIDAAKSPREVMRRVGMVFQDADSQIVGETVREDVAFGPQNLGLARDEVSERVRVGPWTWVGILHLAEKPCHMLSGGEKRRVAIAGVLAMKPEVVVFDEPFANLDYPGVCQVLGEIVKLRRMGRTLVATTPRRVKKWCRWWTGSPSSTEGELKVVGTPDEIVPKLSSYQVRAPPATACSGRGCCRGCPTELPLLSVEYLPSPVGRALQASRHCSPGCGNPPHETPGRWRHSPSPGGRPWGFRGCPPVALVQDLKVWGIFLVLIFLIQALAAPGDWSALSSNPASAVRALEPVLLACWRLGLILCYSVLFHLRDPAPRGPGRRGLVSETVSLSPGAASRAHDLPHHPVPAADPGSGRRGAGGAAERSRLGDSQKNPLLPRQVLPPCPFFRRSLIRADEMAVSLAARGYREDLPSDLPPLRKNHAAALVTLGLRGAPGVGGTRRCGSIRPDRCATGYGVAFASPDRMISSISPAAVRRTLPSTWTASLAPAPAIHNVALSGVFFRRFLPREGTQALVLLEELQGGIRLLRTRRRRGELRPVFGIAEVPEKGFGPPGFLQDFRFPVCCRDLPGSWGLFGRLHLQRPPGAISPV